MGRARTAATSRRLADRGMLSCRGLLGLFLATPATRRHRPRRFRVGTESDPVDDRTRRGVRAGRLRPGRVYRLARAGGRRRRGVRDGRLQAVLPQWRRGRCGCRRGHACRGCRRLLQPTSVLPRAHSAGFLGPRRPLQSANRSRRGPTARGIVRNSRRDADRESPAAGPPAVVQRTRARGSADAAWRKPAIHQAGRPDHAVHVGVVAAEMAGHAAGERREIEPARPTNVPRRLGIAAVKSCVKACGCFSRNANSR